MPFGRSNKHAWILPLLITFRLYYTVDWTDFIISAVIWNLWYRAVLFKAVLKKKCTTLLKKKVPIHFLNITSLVCPRLKNRSPNDNGKANDFTEHLTIFIYTFSNSMHHSTRQIPLMQLRALQEGWDELNQAKPENRLICRAAQN